jgi:transketolase
MPNLAVLRPGDANEAVEAWRVALARTNGPTALALSRQALPIFDRSQVAPAEGARRGGYVLADASNGAPSAIIIASGSEVRIAMDARADLEAKGIPTRVVSLMSWELFDEQPQSYRDQVLPPSVDARVSIEAGVTLGWCRYVGDHGASIGVDHFGASAPEKVVFQQFGLTKEHVAAEVERLLASRH